jgi:hypothetical protein
LVVIWYAKLIALGGDDVPEILLRCATSTDVNVEGVLETPRHRPPKARQTLAKALGLERQ